MVNLMLDGAFFYRSLVHCRSEHSNNSATYFLRVDFAFRNKKETLHCPFVVHVFFNAMPIIFLQKRKGQQSYFTSSTQAKIENL